MTIDALFLGSIGVLVDTSDMQRRAFNAAFDAAGLDWHWDRATYTELLRKSGGVARISRYAQARKQIVDAPRLHAAKVTYFARMLADEALCLRPGIRDLLDAAANRAIRVGWVTDTGADQLAAIFSALGPKLRRDEFKFIGATHPIKNRKPAPDIYYAALTDLRVSPEAAIAVEDTAVCARAAVAAGIRTFGFPNSYAVASDFADVTLLSGIGPAILEDTRPQATG